MLNHAFHGPTSGPCAVFLHAVGITSWMWKDVITELPDIGCMTIDLPGHGASSDIPWQSLEHTAQAVNQTITAAISSQRPLHLVGLSLGAYVGLLALSQKPAMFHTAMLSGLHTGGMPKPWMMKLMTFAIAPVATRPFMARKTARMMGGHADPAQFVREAGTVKSRAFRKATNAVVDFDLPAATAEIKARVLIAAGSKEHSLILRAKDTLKTVIPRCDSFIAPGLGHGWAGQDPQLFAKVLRHHMRGEPITSER